MVLHLSFTGLLLEYGHLPVFIVDFLVKSFTLSFGATSRHMVIIFLFMLPSPQVF